jgi:cell division cycle 20-like protein 1, cofactor of APC complex
MITQSLLVNELLATPDKKSGLENRATVSTGCSDFSDNSNLADLPVLGNQSSVENTQKLIKEFKPCFSSSKKDRELDSNSEVPLFSNKKSAGDRFIPIRSSSKLQLAFSRLHTEIVEQKTD